ncbi:MULTISPECIES: hypothetical protein [Brucella]|jgi:hypothetical protein|uniref:Uncharacterized protein n=1 Tax=Brucella anthropi TaxID=529 RepID=A0A8I0NAL2_BRUAN|nr:hypothetical protein [Brucella anthropi]KAB2757968.1 hypothetical protein F9K81_11480 [Brucella anthropi]MBE0563602.1 hypothetical protein [Brucella anthropi]MDG9793089.1 hypothetical protein [Brucella anthropi]MDH0580247.1 hypothetical protein [Brucella anthropi]MDH0816871.1 hypothetical protein [Brucella anthropi]
MGTLWGLIPSWVKTALAALVAAFLLLAAGYLAGKREGRQQALTEQLRETVKAEKERGKDDEKLRGLSDYDFCVLALRRRGLPVEQCDQLRRVAAE